MPSTLHIMRKAPSGERRPIGLPEWKSALDHYEDLRLAHGDAEKLNPVTHAIISLPNRGGDAEIWRPDCQEWLRVFWYSPEGYISFPAPESDHKEHLHRLSLARSLALRLDAKIYDDEGNETD
ncbi:hypothetical protein MTR62_04930 [Novosphingobium sp. 1949]|uniref:Uncharacterized protein n=1 Tax=Novosphingobium organovorum TaxID=2930092 RepID=A0ABT0BAS3_9SPHN|nr:hypothetical protein [Novosphingobium organovorum]MCJ2182049.1 hypothetical protein [Novosphingobium organovorum]